VVAVRSISRSDPNIKAFSFAGVGTTILIKNLKDKCENSGVIFFIHSFILTIIAGDSIYSFPAHVKTMSIEENAIVQTDARAKIIQFYMPCSTCSDRKVEEIPKSNVNNLEVSKLRKEDNKDSPSAA